MSRTPFNYDRDGFLDELKRMHYGHWLKVDARLIYDLFRPLPQPSLFEVVLDIQKAIATPRDESVSNLPPDNAPKTSIEILQRELGSEFIVQKDFNPSVVVIVRPVENCPHCRGRGYYDDFAGDPYTTAFNSSVAYKRVECDHKPIANET